MSVSWSGRGRTGDRGAVCTFDERLTRGPSLTHYSASMRTALFVLLAAARIAAAEPHMVPIPGSEHHRLRFDDGSLSINDRCPVAKRNLNPRMRPIWVNGRPVGFC